MIELLHSSTTWSAGQATPSMMPKDGFHHYHVAEYMTTKMPAIKFVIIIKVINS